MRPGAERWWRRALKALVMVGTGCVALPALAQPAGNPRSEPAGEQGPRSYERDVVEVEPAQPITLVDVDNRLGNVRIEGHDGATLVISAVKHAPDEDTLERLKVTLIPDPKGPMHVATAITASSDIRPIAAGAVRVDLVIRAPRSARVEARVWNGQLQVQGMENGAELAANDGRIEVKNASGTIVAHSTAGDQHFLEIYGALEAQAVRGTLALDAVRGQRLDASVHEGRIQGRAVRVREAYVRTTRGDIQLSGQAMAGGRYRVASYQGNVELTLSGGVPLSVRVWSQRGQVSLPEGTSAERDEQGMLAAMIPAAAREGERMSAAVVEIRSHLGNIQLAVVQ